MIAAPGYDRLIAPVSVTANATTTLDAALRRNWASQSGGGSASGSGELASNGCGPLAAIDQQGGTAWSTPSGGRRQVDGA